MGIVYHTNYLNWFEIARTEWFRQSGTTYRQLEEKGLMLPVTKIQCEFINSAKYDDWVEIAVSVKSYNKVRLSFEYEIHRLPDQKLLVRGTSEHVFTTRTGKIVRLDKAHPEVYQFIVSQI
ncbi:MAG: yneP [Bacilli bacterium]|nr:yneP [Bacilli bacterium]